MDIPSLTKDQHKILVEMLQFAIDEDFLHDADERLVVIPIKEIEEEMANLFTKLNVKINW